MEPTNIIIDETVGIEPLELITGKKVLTKVKLVIQYQKDNAQKIHVTFILPMSKFIDNDGNINIMISQVFHEYLTKSIKNVHGLTPHLQSQAQLEIRAQHFSTKGAQKIPGGKTSVMIPLSGVEEGYLDDYFTETIEADGGFHSSEHVNFFIKFLYFKIPNSSYPIISPINEDDDDDIPYDLFDTVVVLNSPTYTRTPAPPLISETENIVTPSPIDIHHPIENISSAVIPHQGSATAPSVASSQVQSVTPRQHEIPSTVIHPITASTHQGSATSRVASSQFPVPLEQGSAITSNIVNLPNSVPLQQGSATTLHFDHHTHEPHLENVESEHHAPPSPLNPRADNYVPHWRDSPHPHGPWIHNGISRNVTFRSSPQDSTQFIGQSNSHEQPFINRQVPHTPHTHSDPNNSMQRPTPSHYSPPHAQVTPDPQVPPSAFHSVSPNSNAFNLQEFGILTMEDFCSAINRTPMDTKTFLKKDYVPVQGSSSILNWYRRFVAHGQRTGVFIPPFESLIVSNTMGGWVNHLSPNIVAHFNTMSQCILTAIINFQAIPTGPEFTKISSVSCGYVALHNIMRNVHPRLMLQPTMRYQPRCKPNENVSEYVNRLCEYILLEYENGKIWRRYEIAQHIIGHLPQAHSLWIQSHFDTMVLSQGHYNDVPPAYCMSMIACTIETLIPKNPSFQTSHHRSSHALVTTNDTHDDSSYDDDDTDPDHIIHALINSSSGPPKHCKFCDSDTHNLKTCFKYISICLGINFVKQNPSTYTDVINEHKFPPKMVRRPRPSTSSRPNTSHTLLEQSPDTDAPDIASLETAPISNTIHSISVCNLVNFNEDHDTSDDESIDDHPLCSIDFDFDVPTFCSTCPSPLYTAQIVAPPATIVNSVDDGPSTSPAIGGQFDSGANMNTTNHLDLLWNLEKLSHPKYTLDAGQKRHIARYRGYLLLPCTRDGTATYFAIDTYYTPSIGVTLIAPSSIRDQISSIKSWQIADSDNIASATFQDVNGSTTLAFPLYSHNNLHWTAPFVRPTITQRRTSLPRNFSMSISSVPIDIIDQSMDDLLFDDLADLTTCPSLPDDITTSLHALHARTQYQLWHQRLGHIQPRTVTDLHKHVDGIPTLSSPTLLDNCPICIQSKMRRADSSPTESRVADQCYQSLSIDMAFIVQQSKNTDRYTDNIGLKGETCYVLITDYFSGMVHGKVLVNKGPPIEWFNQWLARFSPDITHKTVRFDQGGELGRCRRIIQLFQSFGYTTQLTGADSSHQNGSVERSHRKIGNMIRSLLHGAALSRKFWPYAFYHTLFIMNRVPHHGKDSPPITMCSGKRLCLESLRIFGCRVYVRLPGERKAKLDSHTLPGVFLGYNETMKNIFWYDPNSSLIKTASHVRFDEGMADVDDPPPNVKLLQRVEHDNILPDVNDITIDPVDFQLDSSPFRKIDSITIDIICTHATFGFLPGECNTRHRAYVSDIAPNTSASRIRNIRHKYIGAYIVQVHLTPVFSLDKTIDALTQIHRDQTITSFIIQLAPDKYIPVRNRREPLRINAAQLASITTLRMSSLTIHSIAADSPSDTSCVPITSAEHALKDTFTRFKLLKLDTWPLWQAAEFKQLDAHHAQGMFGDPMIPPPGAIILHPHWRYKIKTNGTRSGRLCCDGSPRAAPALHENTITYASCIELPCMRLFFSLMAVISYYVLLTDAVNAYANARGPTTPTYIRIDDAYIAWYYQRFNITLTRGMVYQALHALQGHPEAGKLFEELANDILLNRLGLQTTSHERNLYHGLFNGHRVFICRQVDDLAIAAPSMEIGQQLIAAIGSHVQLAGNSLLTKFNGVQVEQSCDYIRLHCSDYIDRLVLRHGWATPGIADSSLHDVKEPMSPSVYKQVDTEVGPPEHSPDGMLLPQQAGFQYRQLLGELIYAYVICRLDIGYALTKLAQYSNHPSMIHFTALKHVAIYLRSTKSWGIMYWRPTPMPSLPPGDIPPYPVSADPTLPPFPINHSPSTLVAYVDAAHATDNTRRSVTGYLLSLCGGAVCYRSKHQTAVAISSTEAELVASVSCGKTVKYIRTVLSDFGFPQLEPTTIYEDNAASILIVNAGKPTPRTRHIDIQYFAIQEWKALGQLVLLHIAGIINIADALTKALGWILHHRHVRRSMGHHACQYTYHSPS